MANNPAQELIRFGQSVWYDNISRDLLESGDLKKFRDEWGVRGLTSNPTIFENALKSSNIYDDSVRELKGQTEEPAKIFEELAVQDVAQAADLLRPVYDESQGDDGFCSIEVSPLLARDTQGTIEEAKRLHRKLERPNIMIKIPGTPEGLPAIRRCLEEGISVNVTLLFSVENYVDVAKTYCEAMKARVDKGLAVDKIRSVASFFVSRVDSKVDAALEGIGSDEAKALIGAFGIANSRVAYKRYQEIFEGDDFADLKGAGVAVQRPLWASTSTKNPDFSDVLYIEELIGANTVNTMPHNTLEAFVDHGVAAETITKDVDQALELGGKLGNLGVNLDQILDELQVEGVQKFADSFDGLIGTIETKLSQV